MTKLNIKGHEFNKLLIRDSYDRRATQFKNNIIQTLKKIEAESHHKGLTDKIKIYLEKKTGKKIETTDNRNQGEQGNSNQGFVKPSQNEQGERQ